MKCKYCVEEYRYYKTRRLLDIKNVAMITDGVGYCFKHLDYHNKQSFERHLQERLAGTMQREREMQERSAMIAPSPLLAPLMKPFGW
jgi:hypothetical protein